MSKEKRDKRGRTSLDLIKPTIRVIIPSQNRDIEIKFTFSTLVKDIIDGLITEEMANNFVWSLLLILGKLDGKLTTLWMDPTRTLDSYGFNLSPKTRIMVLTENPTELAFVLKKHRIKLDEQESEMWWAEQLMLNDWGRFMPDAKDSKIDKLKGQLRRGIPPSFRGDIWFLLSGARDLCDANQGKYEQYCAMAGDPLELNVISRDIGRTFPHHPYFQTQVGKHKLKRTLQAISNRIGQANSYCQGMNFIVGMLLLNMNEEAAFWTFFALVEQYGMKSFFDDNVTGLVISLLQFDKVLAEHAPDISAHLSEQLIDVNLFATPWFLTLFSYNGDHSFVSRVWDMFFFEKFSILFKISVAIMLNSKDYIFSAEGSSFVALKEYLLLAPSQISTSQQDQFFHDAVKIDKNKYSHKIYTVEELQNIEKLSKNKKFKLEEKKMQEEFKLPITKSNVRDQTIVTESTPATRLQKNNTSVHNSTSMRRKKLLTVMTEDTRQMALGHMDDGDEPEAPTTPTAPNATTPPSSPRKVQLEREKAEKERERKAVPDGEKNPASLVRASSQQLEIGTKRLSLQTVSPSQQQRARAGFELSRSNLNGTGSNTTATATTGDAERRATLDETTSNATAGLNTAGSAKTISMKTSASKESLPATSSSSSHTKERERDKKSSKSKGTNSEVREGREASNSKPASTDKSRKNSSKTAAMKESEGKEGKSLGGSSGNKKVSQNQQELDKTQSRKMKKRSNRVTSDDGAEIDGDATTPTGDDAKSAKKEKSGKWKKFGKRGKKESLEGTEKEANGPGDGGAKRFSLNDDEAGDDDENGEEEIDENDNPDENHHQQHEKATHVAGEERQPSSASQPPQSGLPAVPIEPASPIANHAAFFQRQSSVSEETGQAMAEVLGMLAEVKRDQDAVIPPPQRNALNTATANLNGSNVGSARKREIGIRRERTCPLPGKETAELSKEGSSGKDSPLASNSGHATPSGENATNAATNGQAVGAGGNVLKTATSALPGRALALSGNRPTSTNNWSKSPRPQYVTFQKLQFFASGSESGEDDEEESDEGEQEAEDAREDREAAATRALLDLDLPKGKEAEIGAELISTVLKKSGYDLARESSNKSSNANEHKKSSGRDELPMQPSVSPQPSGNANDPGYRITRKKQDGSETTSNNNSNASSNTNSPATRRNATSHQQAPHSPQTHNNNNAASSNSSANGSPSQTQRQRPSPSTTTNSLPVRSSQIVTRMSALKSALQQIKPEEEEEDAEDSEEGETAANGTSETGAKPRASVREREKTSAQLVEYIQKQFPGYANTLKDFLALHAEKERKILAKIDADEDIKRQKIMADLEQQYRDKAEALAQQLQADKQGTLARLNQTCNNDLKKKFETVLKAFREEYTANMLQAKHEKVQSLKDLDESIRLVYQSMNSKLNSNGGESSTPDTKEALVIAEEAKGAIKSLLEKKHEIQANYEKEVARLEVEKGERIAEIKEKIQSEKVLKLSALAQHANQHILEKQQSLLSDMQTERKEMEEVVVQKIRLDTENKKQRLAVISEQDKVDNLKKILANLENRAKEQQRES